MYTRRLNRLTNRADGGLGAATLNNQVNAAGLMKDGGSNDDLKAVINNFRVKPFIESPEVIQTEDPVSGSVAFEQGIGDCFEFIIDATNATSDITLAILPGYFNTQKVETTIDATAGTATSIIRNCDPTELNTYTGIQSHVVLDDLESYAIGNKGRVTIHSTDSQFTCKNFREFILQNNIRLNQFVIRGAELQNLNSVMKMGYCNAFRDLGSNKIKLDRYFNVNQYQDGQMTVIAQQNIQLNKNVFWTWSIPAGEKYTFAIYI